MIIQRVNKIQLKLCLSAIQTLTAFITCSSTPKALKWTPRKKKNNENGAKFFSPLGQYSMKSQNRKAVASVESRMGGKKKKCDIVYPFAAETRGSNAMSLHHPDTFKLCGTERKWDSYKPAERCSNQSTNSRKKKHSHLCPGIADANWTQQ